VRAGAPNNHHDGPVAYRPPPVLPPAQPSTRASDGPGARPGPRGGRVGCHTGWWGIALPVPAPGWQLGCMYRPAKESGEERAPRPIKSPAPFYRPLPIDSSMALLGGGGGGGKARLAISGMLLLPHSSQPARLPAPPPSTRREVTSVTAGALLHAYCADGRAWVWGAGTTTSCAINDSKLSADYRGPSGAAQGAPPRRQAHSSLSLPRYIPWGSPLRSERACTAGGCAFHSLPPLLVSCLPRLQFNGAVSSGPCCVE
jgi:hypothetical protein